MHTWQHLIAAVEQRVEADAAAQVVVERLHDFEAAISEVPPEPSAWATELMNMPAPELAAQADHFDALAAEFQEVQRARPGLWQRLLALLGLYDPIGRADQKYKAAQQALHIRWDELNQDESSAGETAQVCSEVSAQLRAAIRRQEYDRARTSAQVAYDQARELAEQERTRFQGTAAELPEAVRDDMETYLPDAVRAVTLEPALAALESQLLELLSQIDALAGAANRLLDANELSLVMLTEFRQTRAGKERFLWDVRLPVPLDVLDKHLAKWRHLVKFWEAESAQRRVRDEIERLPDETAAARKVKDTADALLALGGRLLRATWLDGAGRMDNAQLQKVRDYAAAVLTVSSKYDPATYGELKGIEEASFPAALQLFPVWATTNLATRSNFPLTAELFDLVIIDEASQCDVPSALPLLFRAKRVVVIGDPQQLRHVATLAGRSDLEAAHRYAIAPAAFQYGLRSLFDVASRSTGVHPGALLLNEHYRSDARIIGFSNGVFYHDRLKIKTDLSRRGFRRSFLNEYGGICWLQVSGATQYLGKGNVANIEELEAATAVVTRLLPGLGRYGLASASIGVVTPYRKQEELLEQRLGAHNGADGRLRIGTAHTFQGDERDFMVFSPVLARGITPGSLDWLERTGNLLNVAVTRPRVALIVVGDWEFCRSLPENSVYCRLAHYVEKQGLPIYRRVDDLPLLSGQPAPIDGYILDPHNPEMNRVTLRRYLHSLREYVWWLDKYFNSHIVDLLDDVFRDQTTRLRQVRLLTAWECTQPRVKDIGSGRTRRRFARPQGRQTPLSGR